MVASGAMNLKNYEEWLNEIESGLKGTRATGSYVAVVLRPVLNIPRKVTSTRGAFKVKSDRSSKARQDVVGWRQKHGIDCGIAFVYIIDLLVIASAKRVNIPDVQTVLLSWFLDNKEPKSTIHFSKLYRVK